MGNKSSKSNSNVPPDSAAATVSQSSNPSLSGVEVWYRHSGEAEIDKISLNHKQRVQNYEEITRSVGSHYITHMSIHIRGNELPPLDAVAPHLTHLMLKGVTRQTNNLDCLKTLQQLQVLDLTNNDFSTGLPKVVSELVSLRELKLKSCSLRDLPNSMKTLQQLQVLDLSHNIFSTGFPKVVSELVSLRELKLNNCHLTGLPNSLKTHQQLQVLDISENDFREGLPKVVSELVSLRELKLNNCNLTDLPNRISTLQNLEKLTVKSNCLAGKLPAVIYQLPNLAELDISGNQDLTEIEFGLLKLVKLNLMECDGCYALRSPPYAVCKQGVSSINKYLKELIVEAGTEVVAVPVAVVGNLMAGKTSLIRSLISGNREFTFRKESSPLDETTEVFTVNTLALKDSLVRLIDFGGHDIYHMAYQLTLKEQCIPFIVVNLEEYHELSHERGPREATRRCCIDWLSHLYLACPRLGAPILVLTHRDKLSDSTFELCKDQLLTTAETIRLELLKDENELSEGDSRFCQIVHLSDKKKPLFHPNNIFLFANNSATDNYNIHLLQECIDQRCAAFKIAIPRHWELVSSYMEEKTNQSCILLSDIETEFPHDKQIEVILRYLHNSGKVLWFENKSILSKYIFHQIPKVVEMVALIFHHSGDKKWKEKMANFSVIKDKNRIIGKIAYEDMVKELRENGVMDEAILTNLLTENTQFDKEVAMALLSSFHIIYGPINQTGVATYIIPYFSAKYMGRQWQSDGYLQLRAEIMFNGLPLPRYVYQLITVAALNFRLDPTCSVKVANDGVTIQHGSSKTHLVHDYNNSKVTLQISTPVELIGSSWQRLIELVQHVIGSTTDVWEAVHPEVVFYCAHCLFKKVVDPEFKVNPSWFLCTPSSQHHKSDRNQHPLMTTFGGVEPVTCRHAELGINGECTLPKPFRFPCYKLTEDEILKLKRFLVRLDQCRPNAAAGGGASNTSKSKNAATDESDISDAEDEGYADFESCEPRISLRLHHTDLNRVQVLFDNTNKVYPMSDPVRGRVMIINNKNFYKGEELVDTRDGSEVDCANLAALFKELRFEMVKPCRDLKAEDVYSKIEQETHLPEHHSYGCFFLVLMSHGTRGDNLYDCHLQPIDLVKIKDLLSPSNFPAMKGKPKVIIIQACSGDRVDLGNAAASPSTSSTQPAATSTCQQQKPFDMEQWMKADDDQRCGGPSADFSKLDTLNADDFFIIKATTESYKAVRSNIHGSWFIRILVATFYKHSCHRHIEELFKIIQDRVRKVSIAHTKSTGKPVGGCVPDGRCTFTNFRKLYLFPEYPPK